MSDDRAAQQRRTFKTYGLVFLGYGVLCLVTAMFMSASVKTLVDETVQDGGVVGPIDVPAKNTVYEVSVGQEIRLSGYGEVGSTVTVSLLDKDRNVLMAFGDDFWRAAGRDGDGPWSESKLQWSTQLTLPDAGLHYLGFTQDADVGAESPLRVKIQRRRGSGLMLYWLAVPALAAAALFGYRWNKV